MEALFATTILVTCERQTCSARCSRTHVAPPMKWDTQHPITLAAGCRPLLANSKSIFWFFSAQSPLIKAVIVFFMAAWPSAFGISFGDTLRPTGGGRLAQEIVKSIAMEYGWPDFGSVTHSEIKLPLASLATYVGARTSDVDYT